jgi:hypothetical protein
MTFFLLCSIEETYEFMINISFYLSENSSEVNTRSFCLGIEAPILLMNQ